jgi:hypothetical protein
MNRSISATTMEKIAGVWQTADPISMLVVSLLETAGWREIPRQAWPPGNPDPTPEPIAPNPMLRPAPKRAAALSSVGFPLSRNRSRIATTSEKMEADSATACPTSMFLKISPEIFGFLETARLAWAAVYPSPTAAPTAPRPMAIPPPANAATLTQA